MRVLIVEDEPYLAEAIRDGLRLQTIAADIAVLDRNIPGPSGDEIAKRMVACGSGMPILMLTAADQRSFAPEHVDLSLMAEEPAETLLPLAEKRGLTIAICADMTPTIGSHALLLQMTTNLVHNAIVHNLPEQGSVWVTTSVHPKRVVLTVENTGEKLTPQLVSTLVEPFRRGTERIRSDHAGVGLGLAIVKSITQAHDGTLTLTPRAGGGLCVMVQLPAAPPHTGR
jgi:two-component system sensor histidine kinase VanS